jgi:regulator of protease activity HflC (stomatin/prohibitin superfamily)
VNWFSAVIEFLERFWPLEKVMEFERGVPYLNGHLRERATWWCYGGNLEPGLYVIVPWFMEIHQVAVKPDILKLWNLNVTTRDDKPIRLRANVRYEIFDAVKAWNEVQDFKDNLGDEARTHIASVVRERDYSELLGDQGKIERECKNEMNKVVKDWGIKVIRVGITDFIKTKDISLASV